jgi:DNA-directed RNA polymerase subunit RPC12/RpoP
MQMASLRASASQPQIKTMCLLNLQRNVERSQMAKIPCILCSKELQLRRDKHRKPYFICDSCGVQLFVRGRQGIENLAQLIKTLRERDFPFREHAGVLHEIQAVLTELRGVEKEIEKLDSTFDVFASDRHKKRARKSLDARIELLLVRLERMAHVNTQSAQKKSAQT